MPVIYTDSEIATLLQERKVLPFGLGDRAFRMKPKVGHTEGEATLMGGVHAAGCPHRTPIGCSN